MYQKQIMCVRADIGQKLGSGLIELTPINSLSDNDSNKHSETGRVCVDKDVKGNYKIFYQHFSKINYLHWRDEIHQMMPENIG